MKKFLLVAFALCCALAVQANPAAEGDEREAAPDTSMSEAALQPPAETLPARVDALEKKTTAWGKIVEKLPKISGYAQIGYQWDDNSLTDASNSSFSIMSVRLSLAGDLGAKFDYKVQLEFASFKLIDAFVRYKIHPGFSLQAGQFHTNFSLEGPFGALDMEAISYAPVVEQICTKVADSRDIGLAAYGAAGKRDGFNLFEYSLGVFNGEGKNAKDANKSKDIVGRLKLNPVKDLTLSGSFSYGEKGDAYVHNTRVAGGVWYHSDTFWARSEYLGLTQKTGGMTTHIDGAYLTTGYWFGEKLHCPLARFSYMDSGLGGSYVQQSELLIGYDYKPIKNLRVQLNYAHSWFKQSASKWNTNIVGVSVTGIF